MNVELQSVDKLKEIEGYTDFTILDTPVKFSDLFKNRNFDVVEVHSIQKVNFDKCKEDIVGFCGTFRWKNNKLESLDGDSYNRDTLIYGYEEFTNKEYNVDSGLSILVGNNW